MLVVTYKDDTAFKTTERYKRRVLMIVPGIKNPGSIKEFKLGQTIDRPDLVESIKAGGESRDFILDHYANIRSFKACAPEICEWFDGDAKFIAASLFSTFRANNTVRQVRVKRKAKEHA